MFMAWLDYFIGDNFRQNDDLYFKTRILVGALMSFVASTVSLLPAYFLLPGYPVNAVIASVALSIPAAAFWLYLLLLIKSGRAFAFVAYSTMVTVCAVLFAGVAITGGPTMSEVHPLLLTPIILAFLLLNKSGGIIWTVIIALIYLAMAAANFAGFDYINLPPEQWRGLLRVTNWLYAFLITAALVLLYENITQRVTLERDRERQKFKEIAVMAVESEVVKDSAVSLAKAGSRLLSSAEQQKIAIEQLATTAEELSISAEKNKDLSQGALQALAETESELLSGQREIESLLTTMNSIKASSQEIHSINKLINEISHQTNLLSLNAMIEASRSNENGGFKVVALEVKKLAEGSASAADDINKLIQANIASVSDGAEVSDQMQKRFFDVSAKIKPLALAIDNVTAASVEQYQAVQQISSALTDIDQVIEDNKLQATVSSDAANELKENTETMIEMMKALQ